MSHQPFEEWIFEEEGLPLEQRKRLQVHLDGCRRCQALYAAWEGIRSDLADPQMVGPEPGFASRWRARYAEQSLDTARRQVSWALGLTILGAGVLAIPLAMQVYAVLEAPAAAGGSVIRGILSLDLALKLSGGFLRALLSGVASQLVPAGWAGIGLALLGFTAVWVLSLYRFAIQPIK